MKLKFIFLLFLFCTSCSVYKSQGRKSFETDTPARVPISLIFNCRPSQSPNETAQLVSLETLKKIPGLVIRQTIYQETVILLASSTHPDLTCFSEGLGLADYSEYHDNFTSQINTWP